MYMRAQLRTLLLYSSLAVGCQLAALLWWAPRDPIDTAILSETALAAAVVSLILGLAVGYIAWDAREWSSTLFALGCLSIAAGAVMGFVCSGDGLGLEPSAGAGFAPVLGMLVGSGWFFLAVQTWWSATRLRDVRQTVATRTLLVSGTIGAALGCYLCAAFPDLVPAEQLTRAFAGIAAAAYIIAGARFLAVWHFLRLPSQYVMTVGSFLLAGAVIVLAGGGIPGLPPYQLAALVIVVTALPGAGVIIEQRARPGLRSMVFGLFVPAAVASMQRGQPKVITGLLERAAAYDNSLRDHIERVADLSLRIALHLKLSPDQVREVVLASQLHDIGKLLVPRDLLLKSGKLAPEERIVLERHSTCGAQIVARIPEIAVAARGVQEHHERWDGSGFPDQKREDEIAVSACIVAVADVYDALRSERAYKREWGVVEAVSEIERGSGKQFEPRVVQALVRLAANGATGQAPLASEQPWRRAA